MTNRFACIVLFALVTLVTACEKASTEPPVLSLLSSSINGGALTDGQDGVAPEAKLELVFSGSLDRAAFETALVLEPAAPATFSYGNQGSRAIADLQLAFNTTYTLRISGNAIGQNGGVLAPPLVLTFTTRQEGSGGSACTSGTTACLASLAIDGQGSLPVYNSFPVVEDTTTWDNLRAAVIVVHGANRNAGDYFEYLMYSLQEEALEGEVLLLAPHFQEETTTGNTLFWSGNSWREGQRSGGNNPVSSFAVVDELIRKLANPERFPVMEKVIITGHSSGGLFTHLFAAANQSEPAYPDLDFEYLVANSQYFYYPDGQRISESSNLLYVPTDCNGYTIWPFGYEVAPSYLSSTTAAAFNDRFINRSVTYLLGNGSGPDGALNTNDCAATLLGPTRYERGENMYRYMELVYGDTHNHQRSIVPGIGHDGAGMYRSATLQALLRSLVE